jgi:hypothetical protein
VSKSRTSKEAAIASLDRFLKDHVRGAVKQVMPVDVDRLAALEAEWEKIAADGPPSLTEHEQFMRRFIPAYNAVWARTGKMLCVECGKLNFDATAKPGRFCSEPCGARHRSRGRLRRWLEKHATACRLCRSGRTCDEVNAKINRSAHAGITIDFDAMNNKDYSARASRVAQGTEDPEDP